ncbi:acyl-CoA thioesterase [Pectobacterium sp. A5351]|uniref:acyl-CoA thioesterase n=1 Tax=Pectobacterium sp. A5351 TaxID=2914983 RepID=UPI00232E7F25|nr:thioesterase family protein [Pectobacterium sp. A5351]WCG82653.1 thioesterase family protein [Pectobacterium sp. A5351]
MNNKYPVGKYFQVSMRDIDLNGHVHNSVYLDYFEDAIVNQLRENEILHLFRPKTSGVAYHVKRCEVVFISELSIDDIVKPHVYLNKIGNSSLEFEIHLHNESTNASSAQGSIVWVCVSLESGRPISVPEETRKALMNGFESVAKQEK